MSTAQHIMLYDELVKLNPFKRVRTAQNIMHSSTNIEPERISSAAAAAMRKLPETQQHEIRASIAPRLKLHNNTG